MAGQPCLSKASATTQQDMISPQDANKSLVRFRGFADMPLSISRKVSVA
jgi:hypothetical protein